MTWPPPDWLIERCITWGLLAFIFFAPIGVMLAAHWMFKDGTILDEIRDRR